jgi:cbb3-type cytochrome oxidase subunit 1
MGGELRRTAQLFTQYTQNTHKIHAATLPRWTDNLLKILSILMF